MKLSLATIALALVAALPAAAQTNYYNGWQQQPGYSDTRPNQAPMYNVPNGIGGYTTQTPGQPPTYGGPPGVGGYGVGGYGVGGYGVGGYGVGGYGVGGYPTQTPPGYINRQGR